MMQQSVSSEKITLIKPVENFLQLDVAELWEYRDLFYFLVWREVKIRYKQTILGAGWAILQPVFSMVVFSIFFGGLAQIPSDGVPYPIFAFTALVPWQFFATGVTMASTSIVNNSQFVKKVYFPRLIIPLASVLARLVDFGMAFIVLLLLMLFYGIAPTLNLVFLPLFMGMALLTAWGISLWLSALNVRFRDIVHILPFFVQMGLFMTPVVYPSSLLGSQWQILYSLNPMVSVIEGFRWGLLGTDGPLTVGIAISAIVSLGLFTSGLLYFQRVEDSFADII